MNIPMNSHAKNAFLLGSVLFFMSGLSFAGVNPPGVFLENHKKFVSCLKTFFLNPPKNHVILKKGANTNQKLKAYFEHVSSTCTVGSDFKVEYLHSITENMFTFNAYQPSNGKVLQSFASFDFSKITNAITFEEAVQFVRPTRTLLGSGPSGDNNYCAVEYVYPEGGANAESPIKDDEFGLRYNQETQTCTRICDKKSFLHIRPLLNMPYLYNLSFLGLNTQSLSRNQPALFEISCESCVEIYGGEFQHTLPGDNGCYNDIGCSPTEEYVSSNAKCMEKCQDYEERDPQTQQCKYSPEKECHLATEQLNAVQVWDYKNSLKDVELPECSNAILMTSAQLYQIDAVQYYADFIRLNCSQSNTEIDRLDAYYFSEYVGRGSRSSGSFFELKPPPCDLDSFVEPKLGEAPQDYKKRVPVETLNKFLAAPF